MVHMSTAAMVQLLVVSTNTSNTVRKYHDASVFRVWHTSPPLLPLIILLELYLA